MPRLDVRGPADVGLQSTTLTFDLYVSELYKYSVIYYK